MLRVRWACFLGTKTAAVGDKVELEGGCNADAVGSDGFVVGWRVARCLWGRYGGVDEESG